METVDGALEGAGEFLPLFVKRSEEVEFMIARLLEAEVYLKHRSSL